MNKGAYKGALDAANLELHDLHRLLTATEQERQRLITRISSIESTVAALKTLMGELPDVRTLGLAEAVRQIVRTSDTDSITAPKIRDRLKALDYDLGKYPKAISQINTALKRLVGKDLIQAQDKKTGKTTFIRRDVIVDAFRRGMSDDEEEQK